MSVTNNLNVRLVHAAKTIDAWANTNVVPILGEVCLVADSTSAPMKYKIKIGDGNRYVAKMVGGAVVDEEDTSDGGILPYFGDFDNLDVNTFQLVAITPGKKNPSDTENNKTTVTFKGIKEVDGKIQVDNTSVLNLEIDGVYDSSNPTKWLVTKDTAVSMISDAINSLDGSATASANSVLTGVTETNGIISKSSEVSYTTIAPVQNVTTSDTGDSGLEVTTSTNTKDVHHKDVNSQRQSTAPTSEGIVPVIMGSVDNYGHVSGEVVSSDKIIAADIKAPVTQQDNSTWNHRVTGGEISIGEDIAKIPSLKGNTMVWNTLLNPSLYYATNTYHGVTVTKSGNGFTISGTCTRSEQFALSQFSDIIMVSGHRYLLRGATSTSPSLRLSDQTSRFDTGNGCIWTCANSTVPIQLAASITNGVTYSGTFVPQLFDLTLMFGETIANSMTVEAFEKLFPNSYYPYCEGRLVNLGGYGVKWNQLYDTTVPTAVTGHKYYLSEVVSSTKTSSISTTISYTTGSTSRMCIDLTMMFGPGSEPTLEEFEAMFPNDYYEYNAGTEMNIFDAIGDEKLGLESVGFNQWDEEWENGELDSSGNNREAAGKIRSKNYIPIIPNTVYYARINGACFLCFYDSNKGFISSVIPNNSTFTTPSNAAFVRFNESSDYGHTYNHDICINISDPKRNGTYEPYKKDTLDLDWVRNLEYTPEGSSTPEKLFPYGLLSAGSVHDDVTETKAIKRVGVVDLGSLTWAPRTDIGSGVFNTSGLSDYAYKSNVGALCPKYEYKGTVEGSGLVTIDKSLYFYYLTGVSVRVIYIKDTTKDGQDGEEFKKSVNGILLYYELATPIEIDIYPAKNMSYLADDLGTETQLPVNPSNATPITAPFVGTFEYKSNFKDAIRDLFDKVNNAVNPVKGKDNTSQTVGKLAIYDSSETVKSSNYEPSNATIVDGATGNDIMLPSVAAIVNYVQSVLSSALTYKGTVGTESTLYTHESDASDGDLWIASQTIVVNNDPETTVANGTYYPGTFFIWNEDHWDTVASSVSVVNNNVQLTFNSTEQLTIGTINGTSLTLRQPNLNFSDPTASGNALSFIDYIKQENGLLNATKKTVQSATQSQLGVIKACYDNGSTPSIESQTSTSGRYYGLETDSTGKAFTNIPWTDSTYELTVNGTVNGDGTSLGTIYTPTATGSQYDLLTANSNGYPIWLNLDLTNSGLLKFNGTGWTLDTNSYITSAVTVLDSIMQNGTAITDSNLSAGLKVIKDGTTSYKKISFAAITNDTSTGTSQVQIVLNGNFS